MEFVAARDFRLHPGQIWKKLKVSHRMVITSNGKPIAVLSDIHGNDLEQELRAQAMAECAISVSRLREQARAKGSNRMSPEDIEREIESSRKDR